MVGREAQNAVVIGEKRTTEFDRCRDQQPICRIAVFEMEQSVAARGRAQSERYRFDGRALQKPLDPTLNRNIEFDTAKIDQERNFPDADRAEPNQTSALSAIIDQRTCRRAQMAAAIQL